MIQVKSHAAYKLSFNTFVMHALSCVLAFLLAGCGGGEDDLDQFIRDAAKNVKPQVKPLPEVKPYVGMEYNADGALSDPFMARKAVNRSGSNSFQPDLKRPKEPAEAYPLESLKYVGMLSKKKLIYALLKTPDGTIQQVKLGNYVGQDYGRVTEITESEVTLQEIVQDDLSGDWSQRISKLNLQE